MFQYLIFQLNRDQKTLDHQGNYTEAKVLTSVNGTEQITYGDRKYNLVQIVLHSGEGTERGHYTTFDVVEKKEFDDSPPSFQSVTEERMTGAKQQGYLYFYEINDRYVE